MKQFIVIEIIWKFKVLKNPPIRDGAGDEHIQAVAVITFECHSRSPFMLNSSGSAIGLDKESDRDIPAFPLLVAPV